MSNNTILRSWDKGGVLRTPMVHPPDPLTPPLLPKPQQTRSLSTLHNHPISPLYL